MTQNIYDDETFFAGDSRLPRSVDGLAKALVAAHPQWADDRQRPLSCWLPRNETKSNN